MKFTIRDLGPDFTAAASVISPKAALDRALHRADAPHERDRPPLDWGCRRDAAWYKLTLSHPEFGKQVVRCDLSALQRPVGS